MSPPPLRSLLAGLAAAVLALGACDAILGIEAGSLTGSGGAMGTGGGGDAGPASDGGGCGDIGFPTTPVLDSFDGGDGPLGPPMWSVETMGAYTVANGQLVCPVGTPGTMIWSTTSFGATQEVYVTLGSVDNGDGGGAGDPGDGEIELLLKNQGPATECDSLQVDYQPSAGMLGLYACPTYTFDRIPFTLVAGDTFGARVCADGTLAVFKNGVLVHAPWDLSASLYATATHGFIGFYSSGLTVAALLDDFGGGSPP